MYQHQQLEFDIENYIHYHFNTIYISMGGVRSIDLGTNLICTRSTEANYKTHKRNQRTKYMEINFLLMDRKTQYC